MHGYLQSRQATGTMRFGVRTGPGRGRLPGAVMRVKQPTYGIFRASSAPTSRRYPTRGETLELDETDCQAHHPGRNRPLWFDRVSPTACHPSAIDVAVGI